MKNRIVLLLLLLFLVTPSFVLQVQGVPYPKIIQSISFTELPYYYDRDDWDSARDFFHYNEIPQLNNYIWDDWQQTIADSPLLKEYSQHSNILKHFEATNGDYILILVNFGVMDYCKGMLITLDKDYNYIDELEASFQTGDNTGRIYLKQCSINKDMQVTVYQIMPRSTTPIMFGDEVKYPLDAQRQDIVYQISPSGKFAKVEEILYQPDLYPIGVFTDREFNIYDAQEEVLR